MCSWYDRSLQQHNCLMILGFNFENVFNNTDEKVREDILQTDPTVNPLICNRDDERF